MSVREASVFCFIDRGLNVIVITLIQTKLMFFDYSYDGSLLKEKKEYSLKTHRVSYSWSYEYEGSDLRKISKYYHSTNTANIDEILSSRITSHHSGRSKERPFLLHHFLELLFGDERVSSPYNWATQKFSFQSRSKSR